MTERKHTAGPWRAVEVACGNLVIEGPQLRSVATIQARVKRDGRAIHRHVANARLIAAAPELLEALEIIADGCAGVRAPHRFGAARDIARAAIAKAAGEFQ